MSEVVLLKKYNEINLRFIAIHFLEDDFFIEEKKYHSKLCPPDIRRIGYERKRINESTSG